MRNLSKAYKNKYRDDQGNLAARRGSGDGDCDNSGNYGEICTIQLDEIILYGHNDNDDYIPVHYIYYYTSGYDDYHGNYYSDYGNDGSYDDDFYWDYGSGDAYESEIEEDEIKNNLTNPCANSIFKELEVEMIKKNLLKEIMQPTAKISLTFAESILKLFNDSDTFNLSITNGYLKEANGSTSGASITISDSYLKSATNLSIARTMIHEMVHAYLNVKYGNALSFDNGMDFRLKMEKYAKDNGIPDINSNKFHHEFMGQYVDAMAISLLS